MAKTAKPAEAGVTVRTAKAAKRAKKAKKAKKAEAVAAKAGKAAEAKPKKHKLILRAADIGAREERFSHPWNPNSEIIGLRLGDRMGLRRVAVSIARIPTGKESYVPHAHQREEEWLYILSGEGLALIGSEEVPVGPGDFIAFPAPQPAHHLKNAGAGDLVYLMGGERRNIDVVDFPTLGKRMVRFGKQHTVYPLSVGQNLKIPKAKKKSKRP